MLTLIRFSAAPFLITHNFFSRFPNESINEKQSTQVKNEYLDEREFL
jgi:hypothetical protein